VKVQKIEQDKTTFTTEALHRSALAWRSVHAHVFASDVAHSGT
jgi:hypothetical protein